MIYNTNDKKITDDNDIPLMAKNKKGRNMGMESV